MAQIINSDKNFKVIEVSLSDCIKLGGLGICDYCNTPIDKGYYVAVLNNVLCEKCYKSWHHRAKNYPEDRRVEESNYSKRDCKGYNKLKYLLIMFWIIFISIYLCSFAIHIAIAYHEDKHIIFTVGDLIDEIESYMWIPVINTITLILLSAAFIAVGLATLLKLEVLWEKFRNIKLK